MKFLEKDSVMRSSASFSYKRLVQAKCNYYSISASLKQHNVLQWPNLCRTIASKQPLSQLTEISGSLGIEEHQYTCNVPYKLSQKKPSYAPISVNPLKSALRHSLTSTSGSHPSSSHP